ncbi:MAG: ATP-binding cassette domain-containing protein [Planctomycetia bacterium]|nr:ATP-binding cassette domain-containing protein [Planctomycetia bacterium]
MLAAVFMLFDAFFTAFRPWPLKIVIDKVINGQYTRIPFVSGLVNNNSFSDTQILYAACISMIIIAICTGVFSYLFTHTMGNISQRFIFQLRIATFRHLQRLSLRFHTKTRLGDIISRLTSDINSIQTLAARGVMLFLSNLLLIFTRLIMMVWLNWRFTLIACSILPFLFWAIWWYTRKIKSVSREARDSDGKLASIAQDTLSSIRIVKGLAKENRQDQLYFKQGQKSLAKYLKRVTHQARMAPVIDLLAASGLILVMFFGTKGVMSGMVTIGDMLVFFFYVSNFYSPIRSMARQFPSFSNGIAGAERVAEVLSEEIDFNEKINTKTAPRFNGNIEFQKVSFEYEPGQPILKNINLKIQTGEHTAIIGATGSGKSTIAGLLLRFYDPAQGNVLIDGNDIRQYTLNSLRSQIGLILQDSYLLAGTIRDNIAFGGPSGITENEIISTARIAHAHEFIQRMPQGYDSIVSDGGANLSGGQRQRIAIARAIISDVPILLFDEPTSNLDTMFESSILDTLKEVTQGRTAIMITHSLRAANMADKVIVLDDGAIIEYGTPKELRINGNRFNQFITAGLLES